MKVWVLVGLVALCGVGNAQTQRPPRVSRYLAGPALPLESLVPEPPALSSATQRDELAELHRLQDTRTPAQVQAAQRDANGENIFAFQTVLGPKFTAENLPLTAELSKHISYESGVVDPGLKLAFHRPRPYVTDTSIHPVCDEPKSDSYPSGHSFVGYLEGYALAEMLPEQNTAILARSRDYAHNRMVCGVHYFSDTEASRTLAAVLFGALLTSPKFADELAAARKEVRTALGLAN